MAINLSKGQKISLKKENGNALNTFCVGANWGAIENKSFFGNKKTAVDLDLAAGIFDNNQNVAEVVYFGKLKFKGVAHSGDDTTGDVDGDDGLDNEVMEINLSQIPDNINTVVFILNSYEGQDFSTIPFASIRLYEGTPTRVNEVVATYNVASNAEFSGYVSMILGKLYRRNGEWKFSAIGEPTKDAKLEQTIETVQKTYL
jgi:tellurium resistance protein TerZ